MFDKRTPLIPDFFRSIIFDSGVSVEFDSESLISFYNVDNDGLVIRLDPSELTTLYAAYRAMVKERLEEERWGSAE